MDSFLNGGGLNQVIYQDPNASEDIMKILFGKNNNNVSIQREIPNQQFYIPHAFLNPKPPSNISFGV